MNHPKHSNRNTPNACLLRVSLGRQRGMTMLGAVFAILLGAFVLTSVLKIGPAYLHNWQIQSILKSIKTEFEHAETVVDKRSLRLTLSKRFNIDQIRVITYKDVEIDRDADDIVLKANYETRIPFIGNIDVMVKFEDNEVRIPYYGNQ